MSKILITLSCLMVLALSLAACSGSLPETSEPVFSTPGSVSDNPASVSENPASGEESAPPTTPPDTEGAQNSFTPPATFSDGKVQGKIRNIFYSGNGNTVIISADKLYLYDLAAEKILAETARDPYMIELFYSIKDGFICVGQKELTNNGGGLTATSDIPGYEVQFYDSSLKKLSSLNVSDLLAADEMVLSEEAISVSQNGNLIAIASNKGLTLYDVSKKEKSVLIDCRTEDYAKRKGIVLFEQAAFVNNDKSIVFKAESFDVPPIDGKGSFGTYGVIDIDCSNLTNTKSDGMEVRAIIPYQSLSLLIDEYKNPSGKLMMLNNETRKTTTLSLTTKKESSVVFGSDNGGYFATTEMINSGAAVTGIHVRVYRSADGALCYEKRISEDSSHMERDPVVKILDDSQTLIVLLGNRQSEIGTIVLFDKFTR